MHVSKIYLDFTSKSPNHMHHAITVRQTCAPASCDPTPQWGYPFADAICIDMKGQCDYDFNFTNYFAYILATVCDIV